jgi:hypothetical protein
MGKYLVIWELDHSKIPIDPKERGAAWQMFMGMVKQDLEKGPAVDWGSFVGESRGYVIHEGSEVEVAKSMQQYVPFVTFKSHPVATVSQIDELVASLLT